MTKRKDCAGPGKVGRRENDRTESDVYERSRKKIEWRKKDARGRWKRTARSRRSDKDQRHGSKSEWEKREKK